MLCRTARSNPPAEISWVVDGRPINAHNNVTPDAAGGFVTTADITVTITNQDRNMKMFSCYAVNQALGETVLESSVLGVLYPPDPPAIFGYQERTPIRAGTLQRLTCVVNGGNPIPTLKWYVRDEEVRTGVTLTTNGNIVSSELAIVTKDSDNGADYRCQANNSATEMPLSTSIKLTVHFPPSGVTIKMKPKRPKTKSTVELICESGGSNPESEISWWRNGFLLNGQPDGIFNTSYGGRASRNILTLNVTSDDDGGVYTCQASNRLLQQSAHDAITLSVLYKPEFQIPTLTTFDLIEGQDESINATAKGNPSEITFKWSRQEGAFDLKRLRTNGSTLSLTSVRRSDSGILNIEASNAEGVAETQIKLNVKCKRFCSFSFTLSLLLFHLLRYGRRLFYPKITTFMFMIARQLFFPSVAAILFLLLIERNPSSFCSFFALLFFLTLDFEIHRFLTSVSCCSQMHQLRSLHCSLAPAFPLESVPCCSTLILSLSPAL